MVDVFSVATAPRPTHPVVAVPLVTPMGYLATCSEPRLVRGKLGLAKDTVTLGTVSLDATSVPPATKVNIAVPYVVQHLTMPKSVTLLPEILIINTPFIPDEWEIMLNNITPFNPFPDVHIGMRFSFNMGIKSPPSQTYTPPNHNSALAFPDHMLSHIHTLRRYSGPFSQSKLESLIGPFWTSPLGTVPKLVDLPDHRIIQDLSFPWNDPSHSSVNDQINIDNFRCDWGTFNEIRVIVMDAPANSEAATLDVDAAFRCCPITPSQQRNFIIHWNGYAITILTTMLHLALQAQEGFSVELLMLNRLLLNLKASVPQRTG